MFINSYFLFIFHVSAKIRNNNITKKCEIVNMILSILFTGNEWVTSGNRELEENIYKFLNVNSCTNIVPFHI